MLTATLSSQRCGASFSGMSTPSLRQHTTLLSPQTPEMPPGRATGSVALSKLSGGEDNPELADARVLELPAILERFEREFDKLDYENTGMLNPQELGVLWRNLLPGAPESDLRKLGDEVYHDLDPNGDGYVSMNEVRKYFCGDPEARNQIDQMIDDRVVTRAPTCKELVWGLLEIDAPRYARAPHWARPASRAVAAASNITILLSVVNYVVESLPQYYAEDDDAGTPSFVIEAICVSLFTIEFLLRLATTPSMRDYWTSFFTWVDVLAIVPFYMWQIVGSTSAGGVLVVLRVLRLLRLVRMLKFGRFSEAVQVLTVAISRSISSLLVSMVFCNGIACTLFASLMWSAERHEAEFVEPQRKWVRRADSRYADAGEEIGFQSIPDSMWWAWVTMTTVGYGDMYPRTGPGKAVGACCMLVAMGVMAFPLTLLSGSFSETMEELRFKKQRRSRVRSLQDLLAVAMPGATAEDLGPRQRSAAMAATRGRHSYPASSGLAKGGSDEMKGVIQQSSRGISGTSSLNDQPSQEIQYPALSVELLPSSAVLQSSQCRNDAGVGPRQGLLRQPSTDLYGKGPGERSDRSPQADAILAVSSHSTAAGMMQGDAAPANPLGARVPTQAQQRLPAAAESGPTEGHARKQDLPGVLRQVTFGGERQQDIESSMQGSGWDADPPTRHQRALLEAQAGYILALQQQMVDMQAAITRMEAKLAVLVPTAAPTLPTLPTGSSPAVPTAPLAVQLPSPPPGDSA